MKLIICSPSTKRIADKYEGDEILVIDKPLDESILEKENTYDEVVAIGGGTIIDAGKIICNKKCYALPTTYSGASKTSHAVIWTKDGKMDIKTEIPFTILNSTYAKELPKDMLNLTKIDCLCHIMESSISPNADEKSKRHVDTALRYVRMDQWLKASLFAGAAIEITGTNILHGLSYPLTEKYGIPHGEALLTILHDASRISKVKELL